MWQALPLDSTSLISYGVAIIIGIIVGVIFGVKR